MRKDAFLSIKKLFRQLNYKKEAISDWITIIGLPFLIIGGVVAYFQLGNYIIKADLEFQFVYDNRFHYQIVNYTSRTAEEPYFGFVITDLNEPAPNYLPLPFEVTTFIKPNETQSSNENIVGRLDEPGHRYMGTSMITCRNCKSTKRYFLYIDNGEPNKGFYVLFKNKDDYSNIINKVNESKNPNAVPLDRRINFSE